MIPPHHSPPDLIVLHTLRCLGFASLERIGATVAHLVDTDAEDVLLALAAEGLVTHHAGDFGGWGLTEAGKTADAEQITEELAQTGARDDVNAAYDDFMGLNSQTLDICGAWQMRSTDGQVTLNDHRDAAYDAAVLDRLAHVDAQAQPICAALGARLHRFTHYGPRLATALTRARDGQLDQVTDSMDSYHTVWFQLHEDLLATLGISRTA